MEPAAQPVLFVSHGAPTLALDGGEWARALKTWAWTLRGVQGILVLSAHWEQAEPVRVMAHPSPETLHDFGGFPEPLYHLRYPSPGDPELAQRAVDLLQAGDFEAVTDPDRALDHGAWVPLRAAFPEARIPVVEVSLPRPRTPRRVLEMGRLLAPLRREGVLLVGSGGAVHNLRLLDWTSHPQPYAWAVAFEAWLADNLAGGDLEQLLAASGNAPFYSRAVPTPEHFDPLFFALGAAGRSQVRTLYRGWSHGSLSLGTWVWEG
jgi:4,5-DOPA dioxygenase extradiol